MAVRLRRSDRVQGREIKSVVCRTLGDPSSTSNNCLVVEYSNSDRDIPLPPNSVRIKVVAAALNFADSLQIQGVYQEKKKCPFIPGNECSGVVLEVGQDVDPEQSNIHVGDHVCAVTDGGAFSEEAIAPVISVIKVPKSSDVEAAAGLPVAFGTAYMGLCMRARVRRGQMVLVLGAAGGVGMAAVQIAKHYQATVIAVVRGKDKAALMKELGADVCIDTSGSSHPEHLVKSEVKKIASHTGGVDIVFDPVGGSLGSMAFNHLVRFGGQVIVVGFASGSVQQYKSNIALVKNITIHGLYWGAHMRHSPQEFRESLTKVGLLYARGDIRVPVSHQYALEQAQEAFQVLKNRSVSGKLLFLPTRKSML